MYDLICLYAFARSYDVVERLYDNKYIPLSFYITILEALIGKPDECQNKIHCDKCKKVTEHWQMSLNKHFEKYFPRYKKFRDIRHETFHRGKQGEISQDIKKLLEAQRIKEEIECAIRILLSNIFYNYCSKSITELTVED